MQVLLSKTGVRDEESQEQFICLCIILLVPSSHGEVVHFP